MDISKVKVGQRVEIGVDAFPEKKFTGKVVEVANIGEQLRNSNAKVFEVKIEVNEFDSIVRPAMTTKNVIITDELQDVLYIPLEAIHGADSLQYVFTAGRRQQVIAGKSNENQIIVRAGLKENDLVSLVAPEDPASYRLQKLTDEELQRLAEEDRKLKEDADKAAASKAAEREAMMQQKMMQHTTGAGNAAAGRQQGKAVK